MHKQVLFKIRGIEFYFHKEDTVHVSGSTCLDKLPGELLCRDASH